MLPASEVFKNGLQHFGATEIMQLLWHLQRIWEERLIYYIIFLGPQNNSAFWHYNPKYRWEAHRSST